MGGGYETGAQLQSNKITVAQALMIWAGSVWHECTKISCNCTKSQIIIRFKLITLHVMMLAARLWLCDISKQISVIEHGEDKKLIFSTEFNSLVRPSPKS